MATKKRKKPSKKTTSKRQRTRKPFQGDVERISSPSGSSSDIYQTNIAKGNLGTLEGETSELAHQLMNRRTHT